MARNHFKFYFIFICFSLVFTTSCKDNGTTSNNESDTSTPCTKKVANTETVKILPLGDSRVEGASPLFESYRYPLWKLLVNADWNFDFIGTRTELTVRPPLKNYCYDNDHEGTSGDKTVDVLNLLENVTFSDTPDVILLCIGGNDLNQGSTVEETISRIHQIIDKLQVLNPNVIIFLEQIAPGRSDMMTPANVAGLNMFHQQILEVANTQTEGNSKVYPINMAENWGDNYMADPLHYNDLGAKVVAERYFSALEEYVK